MRFRYRGFIVTVVTVGRRFAAIVTDPMDMWAEHDEFFDRDAFDAVRRACGYVDSICGGEVRDVVEQVRA